MRLGLSCAPNGSCRAVWDHVNSGKPRQTVMDFPVSRVHQELRIPNNILASIRERGGDLKAALPGNEWAHMRDAIAPLLKSTVEFDRCIDVFEHEADEETFTLCATPGSAQRQLEIYAISQLPSERFCGLLFCPHIIFPMRRR
jgi:hypothetical protein